MTTIYVSIGNSDDKLTQKEWNHYCSDVWEALNAYLVKFHGEWFSLPNSIYQNACWCFEIVHNNEGDIREDLRILAGRYQQDSIAWAVADTMLIGP